MAENNNAIIRKKCSEILHDNNLTREERLFLIFELNKAEISCRFPSLFYAILDWKDKHLKEIMTKNVENYLNNM